MAKNIENPDELNSMVSIYDLRAQKGKMVKVDSKTASSSMCEKLLKARMVSELCRLLFFLFLVNSGLPRSMPNANQFG